MSSISFWNEGDRNARIIYNEIEVVKSGPVGFYNPLNWDKDGVDSGGGYFGIREDGQRNRFIHFAVWDSRQNDPDAVPVEKRVKVLYLKPGAEQNRFRDEGTGENAIFPFPWQENTIYRMGVAAKVEGERILYTAYFFFPQLRQWEPIATLSAINQSHNRFGGYASWIEDYSGDGRTTGDTRETRVGNGWNLNAHGEWQPVTSALLTNAYPDKDGFVFEGRFCLKVDVNLKSIPKNQYQMLLPGIRGRRPDDFPLDMC